MNSKVEKMDFENYLREARSWETDKVRDIQKSNKLAWRIAMASGAIALALAIAVAMLTPLKSVVPFVVRVDNSTGIVDVVETMKDGKTNYDEAVNKFFTQWYVRYREGYSKELAEDYYANVGIMSVGLEQQKYYEFFNPKNPLSPLNVFGPYARVRIDIKGTSFIRSNVALVRYTKKIERGPDKPLITHWAATITFKYSGAPMSEKDRAINPLGFQVLEYRNDPDALPTEAVAQVRHDEAPSSAPAGVTVFPGQTVQSRQALQQ